MSPLDFAISRVKAMLDEISRLGDSDFPYTHSKDALSHIKDLFDRRLVSLQSLTIENDPRVLTVTCAESLLQVYRYHSLLGFVLRSTNIRNSFEIFGPLLRLARRVLGPDTRLIISSEWEYSPHVYNPVPGLPQFVLLGLPACESSNPLLVPLAGHELGHTTWRTKNLAEQYQQRITDCVTCKAKDRKQEYEQLFGGDTGELFFQGNVVPAILSALRQTEESFCDFLGLRCFAESFLYAFAYLITPGASPRTVMYPSDKTRVTNLIRAAGKYNVMAPETFAEWFDDSPGMSPCSDRDSFLLSLADAAVEEMIPSLLDHADAIAATAGIPQRQQAKIDAVLASFRLLTPAEHVGDLTNILNAGWIAAQDRAMWGDMVDNHRDTLSELILKSIEILEFETRLAESPST